MDQIFNKLIQPDPQFMYYIMNKYTINMRVFSPKDPMDTPMIQINTLNMIVLNVCLRKPVNKNLNVFGQQPPPFQNNCFIIKGNIFL